uniref:Uncharacterized protein n=1 Tax=Gossypium raimondii TaxID=29730 RepID=A0A0D2QX54_GOSRA|nr:hypothetical protein B456_004G135300 [Gossypium raimondii]
MKCLVHHVDPKKDEQLKVSKLGAWNQPSVQIKELEAQMTSLEQELELLRTTNRDMEVQIENKAIEAKHLAEQNVGLQSKISEPEMVSQKREKELLTLTKKLEDNENLTVQTNNLLLDMKRLRTQKANMEEYIVFRSDEASTCIKSLMDQLNTLQQELESLHSQKAELELQLERKTRTISDYVTDIEKARSTNNLKLHYRTARQLLKSRKGRCKKWLESTIKNIQSNHQIVADLEQIIEDLKRDFEIKGEDLSTLIENVHTIEVKLSSLKNKK